MTRLNGGRLLAAVLTLAMFAGACGSDAPEPLTGAAADIHSGDCVSLTDREVVIYSGRKENLISPVLEAFTCTTGISTDRVRWGSSTDLALALAEEGDRTEADVFLSQSPGPVGFLQAEGYAAKLPDSVLSLVDPQHRGADGTWVGFSGRKRVLVYNIDTVDPADLPTSIFELTDAAFKGEVALAGSNGSFLDWFTVLRDQHGDAAAAEWLDGMVANDVQNYADNRSIVDAASRGEISMGLVNHYYNYQQSEANGDDHRAANHEFAGDDIGSLLIITAAMRIEGSENTSEAEELIEFMLSESVQRYLTDGSLEYPLAAGISAASILPPLDALEIGTVDFDALGGDFAGSVDIVQASGVLN